MVAVVASDCRQCQIGGGGRPSARGDNIITTLLAIRLCFYFQIKNDGSSIIVQQCWLGWLLCNTDIYCTFRREYFIISILYCISHQVYNIHLSFSIGLLYWSDRKKKVRTMYILYFTNVLLILEALLTGFVLYIMLR